GGEVGRPQDALAGLERRDDVGLLVDVVAEGDDVDAIRADLVEQVLGDAAAAGDVLAVGDDQVDVALADETRELLVDDLPAGPADDVAEAEDTNRHPRGTIAARRRRSSARIRTCPAGAGGGQCCETLWRLKSESVTGERPCRANPFPSRVTLNRSSRGACWRRRSR